MGFLYERHILETHKTIQEISEVLGRIVAAPQIFRVLRPREPFEGRYDADGFTLRRSTRKQNPFRPRVRGVYERSGKVTVIDLRMGVSVPGLVLAGLAVAVFVSTSIERLFRPGTAWVEAVVMPLTMLALIILFLAIWFNAEAVFALDGLAKSLDAKVKAPESGREIKP